MSIIIDDLGDQLAEGERVIALPGPVTCAILPGTHYSQRLARAARAAGKEVMLHLPMQAGSGNHQLGPGALTNDMDEQALLRTLRADLDSVPFVAGVNNHMGSLLTRMPGPMAWVMAELQRRGGLYFVDSRTTGGTVAERVAYDSGLPVTARDVFLDDDPNPALIRRRLAELITMARIRGSAVGIGHPRPNTLDLLERALPHLARFGVTLVPVSELIHVRNIERDPQWQAYLSPSHTGAKNSKQ